MGTVALCGSRGAGGAGAIVIDEDRSARDLICSDQLKPSPLKFPGPAFTSLRALAPKLTRRANGEDGESTGGPSQSSTALSSIDADGDMPLETLSCLARTPAKADVCVGEPERPRDVIDIRRRCWAWTLAAAVAIGLGYSGSPLALFVGDRPKSSVSFCPGEKEARRVDDEIGLVGGEFSFDIAYERDGTVESRIQIFIRKVTRLKARV